MGRSIAELEGSVLRILQKSAGYQGFFSPEKVRDAVQESFDYVSAKMFESQGGQWLIKSKTFNTVSGQAMVDIPDDIAQIRVVRYQIGLSYIPLTYDDNIEGVVYTSAAGMTQFPSTWRFMEGRIYFNPALGVGGEKYLQIEYFSYPERFLTDGQQIPKEFDTSLQNFIKYRAASILAASVGKFNREWAQFEQEWGATMLSIVNKRVNSTQYIREFEG